jgi:hypothetical protein
VFIREVKQKVTPFIFLFILKPKTARDCEDKYNKEGEERNTSIKFSALISLTRDFPVVKNDL